MDITEIPVDAVSMFYAMTKIEGVLDDRDVACLRDMRVAPRTAYERAFVEICQVFDECVGYRRFRAMIDAWSTMAESDDIDESC